VINHKNTVKSFVKIVAKKRKERMALMPDEDFEGDFLEVEENYQGIANVAGPVLPLKIQH
jgi:hypothetical protein